MSGAVELPPNQQAATSASSAPSFWRLLFTTPLSLLVRGRLTGPLPKRQAVVCEIALPPSLQSVVDDVAKRTRLWRGERLEVSRELAAHFADGLDAGRSSDELLRDFGDPAQAAALIRRATKRNRAWPWRAMRFSLRAALLSIACMIVVYGLMAARFYLGRPGPITDFRPVFNAPATAIAEPDRAWPLYRQALLSMPPAAERPDAKLFTDRSLERMPRPGEQGWNEVEAYLRQVAPALDSVRQAASKPGVGLILGYEWSPEDRALWPESRTSMPSDPMLAQSGGMLEVLMPHLASFRTLAITLGWDTQRAAAAGDGATARANVQAMLGISRHARENSTLISQLVSLSALTLTCETINWTLANHPALWSDADLIAIAHQLAAFDDRALRMDFAGERLFFQDVLQRIYTDDGSGDGRITPGGLKWLRSVMDMTGNRDVMEVMSTWGGPALGTIVMGRRDIAAEYDRLMTINEAEAARPLWEGERGETNAIIGSWMNSPYERLRLLPLTLFMPAIGHASINAELVMLRRDGMITAIALELYRRQHGDWPATLAELVPVMLPTLPIDRFDGEPLRFVIRDGKPVVYSVGGDFVDDGGVWAPMPSERGMAMRYWPRAQVEQLRQQAVEANPNVANPMLYGDWVLFPPMDDGPLRREDPALDQYDQ